MKDILHNKKLPIVLIAIFAVIGICLLIPCISGQIAFSGRFIAAKKAAASANSAAKEIEDGTLAQLQAENQALAESIEALKSENATLDANAESLQETYDSYVQIEENQYYLTIIESLTEGMEQVEQYLKEAQ